MPNGSLRMANDGLFAVATAASQYEGLSFYDPSADQVVGSVVFATPSVNFTARLRCRATRSRCTS